MLMYDHVVLSYREISYLTPLHTTIRVTQNSSIPTHRVADKPLVFVDKLSQICKQTTRYADKLPKICGQSTSSVDKLSKLPPFIIDSTLIQCNMTYSANSKISIIGMFLHAIKFNKNSDMIYHAFSITVVVNKLNHAFNNISNSEHVFNM